MAEKTDAELNKLLDYAKQKKEILENIYDITSRRDFKGEESEIDKFLEYLDFREPYYEQLALLNSEFGDVLRDFEIDIDNKNALHRDVSQLLSNATDIAAGIVELDKKNNGNMQKVYNMLLSEIKKINENKKARRSYNFFQAQSDNSK